jgi:3-phenylpropionate/trans-cinnamate dioxygenase ferredoxin reductase subunit
MERVVVVGAGLAGLRACEGLRTRGYDGEIVLIGDEPHRPYDRPPLSKQFLAGEWASDKVELRPGPDIDALALDLRLGPANRATALDVAERRIHLAGTGTVTYDGLVIATGARARTLPITRSLQKAHLLRTLEDASALRADITRPGCRLLVIGGGFIGMEVAATARQLGADVTVVEPLAAPLARVLGPRAGAACQVLHERHGVRMCLGTGVASIVEDAAGTLTAKLTDGTSLIADTVLTGVGAVPNVEWLTGSGLDVGPSGVLCDAALRAGPDVVVAGDLALWPFGPSGGRVRLEHRTNAAEQGDHVAGTLLGGDAPFETVPYVWSDQYDAKIQLLGVPEIHDSYRVVAGSIEEGRLVALYGRDGVLSAAVGYSMPRQLMRARALLVRPTPYDEAMRLFA